MGLLMRCNIVKKRSFSASSKRFFKVEALF